MKTEQAIKRARQKVDAALEDERAYCVALTKFKYASNDETCALAVAADKSFKAARRAVQSIYKRQGEKPPKMPTIFLAEFYLNQITI